MYIEYDYQEGGDLRNILSYLNVQKYSGNWENAAKVYFASTLEGLNELHKKGFIYKDLKPDNSLIDQRGRVLLHDFEYSVHLVYRFEDMLILMLAHFSEEYGNDFSHLINYLATLSELHNSDRHFQICSQNLTYNLSDSSCNRQADLYRYFKPEFYEEAFAKLGPSPEQYPISSQIMTIKPDLESVTSHLDQLSFDFESYMGNVETIFRPVNGSAELVTQSSVRGSPQYTAPESLFFEFYSFSSDLWSLGCVIYDLFYFDTLFKFSEKCKTSQQKAQSQTIQLSKLLKGRKLSRIPRMGYDLMIKLLSIDPRRREALPATDWVWEHPWIRNLRGSDFEKLDWPILPRNLNLNLDTETLGEDFYIDFIQYQKNTFFGGSNEPAMTKTKNRRRGVDSKHLPPNPHPSGLTPGRNQMIPNSLFNRSTEPQNQNSTLLNQMRIKINLGDENQTRNGQDDTTTYRQKSVRSNSEVVTNRKNNRPTPTPSSYFSPHSMRLSQNRSLNFEAHPRLKQCLKSWASKNMHNRSHKLAGISQLLNNSKKSEQGNRKKKFKRTNKVPLTPQTNWQSKGRGKLAKHSGLNSQWLSPGVENNNRINLKTPNFQFGTGVFDDPMEFGTARQRTSQRLSISLEKMEKMQQSGGGKDPSGKMSPVMFLSKIGASKKTARVSKEKKKKKKKVSKEKKIKLSKNKGTKQKKSIKHKRREFKRKIKINRRFKGLSRPKKNKRPRPSNKMDNKQVKKMCSQLRNSWYSLHSRKGVKERAHNMSPEHKPQNPKPQIAPTRLKQNKMKSSLRRSINLMFRSGVSKRSQTPMRASIQLKTKSRRETTSKSPNIVKYYFPMLDRPKQKAKRRRLRNAKTKMISGESLQLRSYMKQYTNKSLDIISRNMNRLNMRKKPQDMSSVKRIGPDYGHNHSDRLFLKFFRYDFLSLQGQDFLKVWG